MEEIRTIEWRNERVITTVQLAEVYETDVNNIQVNFKRNQGRFQENKHFYLLKGQELREFKNYLTDSQLVDKRTPSLYLWTRRGASRHCKILDTEKAWEQFDYLEEHYFNPQPVIPAQNPIQELSPQLQFMITMELKQKALEEKVQQQEETIQSIRDTLTDEVKDYRRWVTKAIGQIAQSSSFGGGPLGYQRAWLESYDRLFEKYPCALDVMIRDAKEVAQKAGKSKTEIKGINKQTVIAGNEFLRNHYITVIKEMLVAYCAGVA